MCEFDCSLTDYSLKLIFCLIIYGFAFSICHRRNFSILTRGVIQKSIFGHRKLDFMNVFFTIVFICTRCIQNLNVFTPKTHTHWFSTFQKRGSRIDDLRFLGEKHGGPPLSKPLTPIPNDFLFKFTSTKFSYCSLGEFLTFI